MCNIFLILLVIVLPLLHFESLQDPVLTPQILFQSFIIFLLSGVFLFKNYRNNIKINYSFNYIIFFAIAYFFLCVLSLRKSINFTDGVFDALKVFSFCSVIILSSSLANRNSDFIDKFVKYINFVCIIIIFYGVIDVFHVARSFNQTIVFSIDYSVASIFGNKNIFSAVLFLCLPLLFYGTFCLKKAWRYLSLFNLLLSFSFIIILQTFGVYAGLGIALTTTVIILFIYKRKFIVHHIFSFNVRRLTVISCCFIAIGAIYFFTNNIQHLFLKLEHFKNFNHIINSDYPIISNSIAERFFLFRNSINLISESPFLGVGISNWKILSYQYGYSLPYLNGGNIQFQHPENDFLWIWSESGVFTMIAYIGIFCSALYYLIKVLKKSLDRREIVLSVSLIFGLTGFFILSFFSFPKDRIFPLTLVALMLGLTSGLYNKYYRPVTTIISLYKTAFGLMFIISIFSIYISCKRMYGEFFLKKALYYQSINNFFMMDKYVSKAFSPYFQIDLTATPLFWYRGLANYYQGNFRESSEYFKKAEIINPYHLHTLNNIASSFIREGNLLMATNYYKRALDINPQFDQAVLNLSIVYLNDNQYENAYNTIKSYSDKKSVAYITIMNIINQNKNKM